MSVQTQNLFQTQNIYGGHISSAEICGGHVPSIDFGAIQTKNNGPILIQNVLKVTLKTKFLMACWLSIKGDTPPLQLDH